MALTRLCTCLCNSLELQFLFKTLQSTLNIKCEQTMNSLNTKHMNYSLNRKYEQTKY
ncbi:hypothetical protein DsansV1_C09g0091341 [Dioscorea sansibarensis]